MSPCCPVCGWVEGGGDCQLSSLILLQILGEDGEKVGDGSGLDQVSSYLHSSLLQPFECLGTSPRGVNCMSASCLGDPGQATPLWTSVLSFERRGWMTPQSPKGV